METMIYPENQFQNRRLLISVAAYIVLSFLLTILLRLPVSLSIILAAQIVLFFLVSSRPVWAIAALLAGQLTASNYVFYANSTQISIRFVWTIFAVLLLISILVKEKRINLGHRAKRVIIPSIIFFVFAIVANIASSDTTNTMEYVRLVTTWLVILILLPAVIKNAKDMKILAIVAIITCSISAVFALAQHFHFTIPPFSTTIVGTRFVGRRAIGLNDNPVDLSFTLPIIIIPALSLLFHGAVNRTYKVRVILSILLMCAAIYFTFTRSGMYALGAGAIALLLFIRTKIKKEIFLAVLMVCVAFVTYTNIVGNRYSQGFSNEDSAAARLVLWQASLKIVHDYPVLGIGNRGFKNISPNYISTIQYDPTVVSAGDILGVEEPHNDFLRVWVSFGTPALIAFLWIFISIIRNFLESYRKSSTRLIKGIALGGFAALVTYIVSAATHNVMDSVCFLWILGGISIATCKLAETKGPKPVKALA